MSPHKVSLTEGRFFENAKPDPRHMFRMKTDEPVGQREASHPRLMPRNTY